MPEKSLYKTTIVIWTEYDPEDEFMDPEDLTKDCTDGFAHLSVNKTEKIETPSQDADWDNNSFFSET